MPHSPILSVHDPQAITSARRILQMHGTIAFPTDTIYGIASNAFDPEGIQKIYTAKQRPEEKALPVLIGEIDQLESLLLHVDEHVRKLAAAFWPGALTLVLPKNEKLPADLSPYPTIGVRMPDLAFTLALLKATGPLATTSANRSGGPNPTTAQDVIDQLDGRVDLILDGGATPGATASTVVDATEQDLKILRQGPISLAELQAVL